MARTKYRLELPLHTDPGHGWLEVPMELVRELLIVRRISIYSYVSEDGHTAYLEEDFDADTFLAAAKAAGWEITHDQRYTDHDSFVRELPHFIWRALVQL